nr:hypothetical protein [Tanacetum cinerariifolium]
IVLTSLDAASILTSGVSVSISPVTEVSVAEVPTGSGFIPTTSSPGTGVPTGDVPIGSGSVPTAGKDCPLVSYYAGYYGQYTKRARIAQSSALVTAADEPASPIGDDSQGEVCLTDSGLEVEQDSANITKTSTLPSDSTSRVTSLAAEVKLLEDKDGEGIAQSREYAPIKRRSLDEGKEAAVERSTKRGSDDTKEMVIVLTSLDAASILTSGVSVSISPVTEVSVAEVPTGSGLDGLDRNNETVAKYLQEYYQFAADFPIEERIELISNLVKYQENYAKVLKYQIQQRKPLLRKQQKDFYMSVLKSHAEEIERFKKKGIRLEHDSAKKVKTSEEVPEENLKEMMQLILVEEVYVEALQVKHPIRSTLKGKEPIGRS